MLDVDHGTGHQFEHHRWSGLNRHWFGSERCRLRFGITKAYTTRVGSGPFPTELEDKDEFAG